VEEIATDLNLPVSQILALLHKGVKKFTKYFRDIFEVQIGEFLGLAKMNVN